MIRNTTLPARTRAEAQLQLTQMHCYTRPTQIRGRCILGGKGRGVLRDFKLSRVSLPTPSPRRRGEVARSPGAGWQMRAMLTSGRVGQYNFRMQALEGGLPGVRKASW